MILSDTTMRAMIRRDIIKVEPEPRATQFQPASLDVRLGEELYDYAADEYVGNDDELFFEPNTFYLGTTQDYIELPNDVAAQLVGRSSIGRKGIVVHKTAGWIDPGFRGQITLELYNFTDEPITLGVESRVAQLVFFELDQPSSGYDGQFQDQEGVQR